MQVLKRSAYLQSTYNDDVIRQALASKAGCMGETWVNAKIMSSCLLVSRLGGIGVGKVTHISCYGKRAE